MIVSYLILNSINQFLNNRKEKKIKNIVNKYKLFFKEI